MQSQYVPSHVVRAAFARAMSDMYQHEVPQYGTLVAMVQHINQQELDNDPSLKNELDACGGLQRLSAERHGAIRLGKAEELATMRRLFAVMGMQPVGYYDLTTAGIPVHSTAFRPLQLDELNANPFRIFTSLLRLDLIDDSRLREQASALLEQRQIFTPRILQLIEAFEGQQGLDAEQAEEFIREALKTFRWHEQATVDKATYHDYLNTHRLIADIVCFQGPHINHLTPRTLNIDRVQQQMPEHGMSAKAIIEGPPYRRVPILLRQTSFRALEEPVVYKSIEAGHQSGSHTARFGEIEQRGMALTPKGRKMYDQLLEEVRRKVPDAVNNIQAYYQQLTLSFSRFADDLPSIHRQGLGYFRYAAKAEIADPGLGDLDSWISDGYIEIFPIIYEDFLPVSAAGIFQSNLDERETQEFKRSPNQHAFESDLGCPVKNEFEFYAQIQQQSLQSCLQDLYIPPDRQRAILHRFNLP